MVLELFETGTVEEADADAVTGVGEGTDADTDAFTWAVEETNAAADAVTGAVADPHELQESHSNNLSSRLIYEISITTDILKTRN